MQETTSSEPIPLEKLYSLQPDQQFILAKGVNITWTHEEAVRSRAVGVTTDEFRELVLKGKVATLEATGLYSEVRVVPALDPFTKGPLQEGGKEQKGFIVTKKEVPKEK